MSQKILSCVRKFLFLTTSVFLTLNADLCSYILVIYFRWYFLVKNSFNETFSFVFSEKQNQSTQMKKIRVFYHI